MSEPLTEFTTVIPFWRPRVTPVGLGEATQQQLDAKGQTHLQVKHARKAPDISMTRISLSTPWRWSHRPTHWQVTVTPALQSHTAEIGTRVRACFNSTTGRCRRFSTNLVVK